jgi:hypothetical protein
VGGKHMNLQMVNYIGSQKDEKKLKKSKNKA